MLSNFLNSPIVGILCAVVAAYVAYHFGRNAGFDAGREAGYGDGKREGAREGKIRGYAVGFDRGRRQGNDEEHEDVPDEVASLPGWWIAGGIVAAIVGLAVLQFRGEVANDPSIQGEPRINRIQPSLSPSSELQIDSGNDRLEFRADDEPSID